MIFTHDITLDLTFDPIKTIDIKQFTKKSFLLHVTVTNKGEPFYAHRNTQRCYFKMVTPDKRHIFTEAIIRDDGIVDIPIPESACLAPGTGKAEIVFVEAENPPADDHDNDSLTATASINSTDEITNVSTGGNSADESVGGYEDNPIDGFIFATMNLRVNIVESAYSNRHITSSDDFDALNKALIAANKTYEEVVKSAGASAENAKQSAENAQNSKNEASQQALLSKSYAVGGTGLKREDESIDENNDNSKYYCEQAQNYYGQTTTKAINAATSETNAANSALLSKSYAVGDTGLKREDGNISENEDNAKHYCKQAEDFRDQVKNYTESLSGVLHPMGTVPFASLPALADTRAGAMYNVSDEFITNTNFKEGSGHTIPAGANVYKTADDKWDILAGTPVTGVKGNSESSYRKGNVNITKANIGLGNVDNTADKDKSVAFATKATQDSDGNVIKSSYSTKKTIAEGDFNNIIDPGFYNMKYAKSNKPSSTNGYGLLVINTNGDGSGEKYITQLAFDYNSNSIYVRYGCYYTKNWSSWKKIYVEGAFSEKPGIKNEIVNLIYPVGSIYMSVSSTSPATLFGGTWVRWGNGKVPVGIDTSNSNFNTTEKTGGSATSSYTPSGTVGSHTLTASQIPSHKHSVSITKSGAHTHTIYSMDKGKNDGTAMRLGTSANYDNTIYGVPSGGAHTHTVSETSVGGGSGHNHTFSGSAGSVSTLQPYITCYMWKRTA